jgi:hypothetical protein
VKEIRVGKKGLFAKVDDEDFPLVSPITWSLKRFHKSSYAVGRLLAEGRCVRISMHRLILGASCPLDNRRCNLRPATPSQNAANRINRYKPRAFRGVYVTRAGTVFAQIGVGRAKQYLGAFPTQELAARAYDAAAVRLFGEFARLNFPCFRPG